MSIFRNRVLEPRTDVWPEAKHREIEERFLKLPDAEDYTRWDDNWKNKGIFDFGQTWNFLVEKKPFWILAFRVRQFNIDEKGTVVSRGDSFRRKRNVQIVEKHGKNFHKIHSA